MDIIVEASPRPRYTVQLVGVEYALSPPKSALSMKLAVRSKQSQESSDPTLMLDTLREWVVSAFGDEVGAVVLARLDDKDDEMDLDHLSELMRKVSEAATGNPTG